MKKTFSKIRKCRKCGWTILRTPLGPECGCTWVKETET